LWFLKIFIYVIKRELGWKKLFVGEGDKNLHQVMVINITSPHIGMEEYLVKLKRKSLNIF